MGGERYFRHPREGRPTQDKHRKLSKDRVGSVRENAKQTISMISKKEKVTESANEDTLENLVKLNDAELVFELLPTISLAENLMIDAGVYRNPMKCPICCSEMILGVAETSKYSQRKKWSCAASHFSVKLAPKFGSLLLANLKYSAKTIVRTIVAWMNSCTEKDMRRILKMSFLDYSKEFALALDTCKELRSRKRFNRETPLKQRREFWIKFREMALVPTKSYACKLLRNPKQNPIISADTLEFSDLIQIDTLDKADFFYANKKGVDVLKMFLKYSIIRDKMKCPRCYCDMSLVGVWKSRLWVCSNQHKKVTLNIRYGSRFLDNVPYQGYPFILCKLVYWMNSVTDVELLKVFDMDFHEFLTEFLSLPLMQWRDRHIFLRIPTVELRQNFWRKFKRIAHMPNASYNNVLQKVAEIGENREATKSWISTNSVPSHVKEAHMKELIRGLQNHGFIQIRSVLSHVKEARMEEELVLGGSGNDKQQLANKISPVENIIDGGIKNDKRKDEQQSEIILVESSKSNYVNLTELKSNVPISSECVSPGRCLLGPFSKSSLSLAETTHSNIETLLTPFCLRIKSGQSRLTQHQQFFLTTWTHNRKCNFCMPERTLCELNVRTPMEEEAILFAHILTTHGDDNDARSLVAMIDKYLAGMSKSNQSKFSPPFKLEFYDMAHSVRSTVLEIPSEDRPGSTMCNENKSSIHRIRKLSPPKRTSSSYSSCKEEEIAKFNKISDAVFFNWKTKRICNICEPRTIVPIDEVRDARSSEEAFYSHLIITHSGNSLAKDLLKRRKFHLLSTCYDAGVEPKFLFILRTSRRRILVCSKCKDATFFNLFDLKVHWKNCVKNEVQFVKSNSFASTPRRDCSSDNSVQVMNEKKRRRVTFDIFDI